MQQNSNIHHVSGYLLAPPPPTSAIAIPPMQCFGKKKRLLTPPSQSSTVTVIKYHPYPTRKNRNTTQWLFFSESRWIPLDLANYKKLEITILLKGTFIDIEDSHLPEVRRVRVFPELDYLSSLGLRYRINKVLFPSI